MSEKDAVELKYCTTQTTVPKGRKFPAPMPPEEVGWTYVSQSVIPEDGANTVIWTWSRPKQTAQSEEGDWLVQA